MRPEGARQHNSVDGVGVKKALRAMGMDVLRHRVLITYEAEAEEVTSEDVVQRILDRVEVP